MRKFSSNKWKIREKIEIIKIVVYLQDEFAYSANRIKMPDDEEEIHGKRIDTS